MNVANTPPIETRASWQVAAVALVVMLMAFGSAWVTAVALKDIAAEAGRVRTIPSLALVWLCSGSGAGGVTLSAPA